MMTLKIAIIAIIISSSAVPPENGSINNVIKYHEEMVNVQIAQVKHVVLTQQAKPAQQVAAEKSIASVEHTWPARQTINKDKTYEQCIREAFERIYNEINKMLDEVVDRCYEQF